MLWHSEPQINVVPFLLLSIREYESSQKAHWLKIITTLDKRHTVMVDVIHILFLSIPGTTFSITVLFLILIPSLGNVNVSVLVI